MDLFNIIGLLISIFGSSFAANAALKSHYDTDIRSGHDGANEKISYIVGNDTSGSAKDEATRCGQKINSACLAWNITHWIPIVLFCLTTMILTIIVITCDPKAPCGALWDVGKWWLLCIVIIDALCFAMAWVAHAYFESSHAPLEASYKACKERVMQAKAQGDMAPANGV